MAGFITRDDLNAEFGRTNVDKLLRAAGDIVADQTQVLDRALLNAESYLRRYVNQALLDDPVQSVIIREVGTRQAIWLIKGIRGLGRDVDSLTEKSMRDEEMAAIRNRNRFAGTPENQVTTDRGIVESTRSTSMESMRGGYF